MYNILFEIVQDMLARILNEKDEVFSDKNYFERRATDVKSSLGLVEAEEYSKQKNELILQTLFLIKFLIEDRVSYYPSARFPKTLAFSWLGFDVKKAFETGMVNEMYFELVLKATETALERLSKIQ